MIDNLSIVVHACARRMLTSFSVDEILLPTYVNFSTNFGFIWWKHISFQNFSDNVTEVGVPITPYIYLYIYIYIYRSAL